MILVVKNWLGVKWRAGALGMTVEQSSWLHGHLLVCCLGQNKQFQGTTSPPVLCIYEDRHLGAFFGQK